MTVHAPASRSGAEIRARLAHPVVDGDGHTQECAFAVEDFLKQVAGNALAKPWQDFLNNRRARPLRNTFWNVPSGPASIDRAMAMLPRLRKVRSEDAGIDFTIVYTTMGLGIIRHRNDEFRRAGCRALNLLNADLYMSADVADRMTPVACIPLYTPEEGLAELDYAVGKLGYKTIMINNDISLPVPEVAAKAPELAAFTTYLYSYAMDARHDYDPFWRRCVELKVSVAGHSSPRGGGGPRNSPSNYVFNHLGSFAAGGEFLCRSLFMGGVTRRFPALKFGFLEGGVAWAADLYASIVEAWEKRNLDTLMEYLSPAKLDMDLMTEMFAKYGNSYMTAERMRGYRETHNARLDEDPDNLDEFKASGIARKEDIRACFVPNFYFGCEADDRLNAIAFDTRLNPMGARLNAMLGSDIGHWDVLNATGVVSEAHELVDEGLMSDDDFRDFAFANCVAFHAGMNPDFFKGTAIEADAAKVMAAKATATPRAGA